MPFNKGDFTQQGVNGHVNATVRLNEKRLVNIDLTSNEEAEGCTIAGTVTDLLNDKVYNTGSAPSGNIEITENTTEPLDIAQYATATVNVPQGGGGAVCNATITNDQGNDLYLTSFENGKYSMVVVPDGSTKTISLPYLTPDGSNYYVLINVMDSSLLILDIRSASNVSDLDNLTTTVMSGTNCLLVTNPDEDSFVTLNSAVYGPR